MCFEIMHVVSGVSVFFVAREISRAHADVCLEATLEERT